MKKIMELYEKYREIVSYLFWGVATTVVSWGSYSFFAGLLDAGIIVANVLSWIFAVSFAYVTNKLWVFQSKSWKMEVVIKEIGIFVSARLVTGILEIILVPFLVYVGLNQTIFGIKGAVSKILVSFLVVILNYVFSKLLVFKDKE